MTGTTPNAALPPVEFRKRAPHGDEKFTAAGLLLVTPDGDGLFIKRKGADHAGEWSIPFGRVEQDEEPADAARRETIEEVGRLPRWMITGLHRETSSEGVDAVTFGQTIAGRFDPELNGESAAYVWAPLDDPPSPLHPGLEKVLRKVFAEEDADDDWSPEAREAAAKARKGLGRSHGTVKPGSRRIPGGLGKSKTFYGGARRKEISRDDEDAVLDALDALEEAYPGLAEEAAAEDAEFNESDHPREGGKFSSKGGGSGGRSHEHKLSLLSRHADAYGRIAASAESRGDTEKAKKFRTAAKAYHHAYSQMSKRTGDAVLASDSVPLGADESMRSFDQDGRMRVAITNISKANICPYRGEEIPDWEELGLEKDRIYKMLRDPEELRKSVPTWNGVQLLRKHVPVDIDDAQVWDIVGTTGTTAEFASPYLRNGLVFWTKDGIDLVESGRQRELSCGYHYDPDMTPGTFEGEEYDGVMRNIRGNHVAIVEEGRAGPDVLVADSVVDMQWNMIEQALRRAWAA
jgi:8-oxo-dGTP pyrophosphatase MutT (NUDIX family)